MTNNTNTSKIDTLTKTDLVAFVLDVATRKGTKADAARSKRSWTNLSLEDLRGEAARLVRRDSKGKKTHLADCVSGVACLADAPSVVKLLSMPTTLDGSLVTCAKCREIAGLDSASCESCGADEVATSPYTFKGATEITDRVCDECVSGDTSKKSRKASAAKAKINLDKVPAEGLAIVYPYKGTNYDATLLPTGQVVYQTETYRSPSAAGKAITGGESNGWRSFRFEQDGAMIAIGALRGDAIRKSAAPKDPAAKLASLQAKLAKAEARVQNALNAKAEIEAAIANLSKAAPVETVEGSTDQAIAS